MNSGFDEMDSQRVAKAALKGFFKITESWGLTEQQQRLLLGNPAEQRLREWKDKKSAARLDEEILLRISHVLGIFKALATMHNENNQRLFLQNSVVEPPFNGSSPLDLMLRDMSGLATVNTYLHGQLQGPYA